MNRNLIQICTLLAMLVPVVGKAQFNFTTNNDNSLNISRYTGSSHNVIIPDMTNEMSITTIGTSAFAQNALTSVVIPNSVISIGQSAFFDCYSLTNLLIGTNVIIIGDSAFANCHSLTNIIIPDSVISLGNSTFNSCFFLAQIKIGNNVTNIGNQTFYECSFLSNVIIPNSVVTIGTNAFSGGSGNRLSYVKFGAGLTTIQDYAFAYTALTNVNIPNNVTSIGYRAFADNFLTQVTIGSGVTNLSGSAFVPSLNLTAAYFWGNAPTADATVFSPYDTKTIVYYLPGTSGWGATFGGAPTALWNPRLQTTDGSFGVQSNQFGFNLTGTTNIPVRLEAATNLNQSSWSPLFIGTLTNGSLYLSDPNWTNYPQCFYRVRSP